MSSRSDAFYYESSHFLRLQRVYEIQAQTFSLLGLDSSTEGQTTPLARCRTKGEALKTLFGLVQSTGADSRLHIAINHADVLVEAEQLKEKAMSQFNCAEVLVSNIGPLVTIHTGLGTRASSWWSE